MYGSEPADSDELSAKIREEIASISEETLRQVTQSFSIRLHAVNLAERSSFERHIYKKY
jgi:cell pole-organizing protein PopZ